MVMHIDSNLELLPNRHNNKARKAVTFGESAKMRLYEMPTDEDRINAWYQDSDYSNFKRRTLALVRCVFAIPGGPSPAWVSLEEKQCWIGLDTFYSKRTKIRETRKEIAWYLAVESQCFESPAMIAQKCWEIVSRQSAEEAQVVAAILEQQVIQEGRSDVPHGASDSSRSPHEDHRVTSTSSQRQAHHSQSVGRPSSVSLMV